MPIITQIICDGCHAVKKEVNHWYALTTTEQGAYLQPLEVALQSHPDRSAAAEPQYLCGRLCAIEALSNWMDRPQSLAPIVDGTVQKTAI